MNHYVIFYAHDAEAEIDELTASSIQWVAEVDEATTAIEIAQLLNAHSAKGDGDYRFYRRDVYDRILAAIE